MKAQIIVFLIFLFQIVLNVDVAPCPPSCSLNSEKKAASSKIELDLSRTCSLKCSPEVLSSTCTKKFYTLNLILKANAYSSYCNGKKKCKCTNVRDLAIASGDSEVAEAVSVATNVCNSQTFPNCKKQTYWVWSGGYKLTKKELKQMGYSVETEDEDD
jgi:hypothetical protein